MRHYFLFVSMHNNPHSHHFPIHTISPPCHSLFFGREHLRSNLGIACGSGSFADSYSIGVTLLPQTSAQDKSRWLYVCSCHVYASHRSMVAQVVPRQGHVANPTCWGLTHALVRIQMMLAEVPPFYLVIDVTPTNQKVLSTWMHSRWKMTPLWSQINTWFPLLEST